MSDPGRAYVEALIKMQEEAEKRKKRLESASQNKKSLIPSKTPNASMADFRKLDQASNVPVPKKELSPLQTLADIAFNRAPSAIAGGLKGYAEDKKDGKVNPYNLMSLGPTGSENVMQALTGQEHNKFEDWLDEAGVKEGTAREVTGGLLDVLANPLVPPALKGGTSWAVKALPKAGKLAQSTIGTALGGGAYEAGTSLGKGATVEEAAKHGGQGALWWGGAELGLGLAGKGIGKAGTEAIDGANFRLNQAKPGELLNWRNMIEANRGIPNARIMAEPEFEPADIALEELFGSAKQEQLALPSGERLMLPEGKKPDFHVDPQGGARTKESILLEELFGPQRLALPSAAEPLALPSAEKLALSGGPQRLALPSGAERPMLPSGAEPKMLTEANKFELVGNPFEPKPTHSTNFTQLTEELMPEIRTSTVAPMESNKSLINYVFDFFDGQVSKNEIRKMSYEELAELAEGIAKQRKSDVYGTASTLAKKKGYDLDALHKLETDPAYRAETEKWAEAAGVPDNATRILSPEAQAKIAKWDEIEQAAKDRFKESMRQRSGTSSFMGTTGQNPLDDLKDLIIIGAAKIAKKGITYSQWAKEMLAEYGQLSEKQLAYVWHRGKELATKGEVTLSYQGQEIPIRMNEVNTNLGKGAVKSVAAANLNKGKGVNAATTEYNTAESIKSYSEIQNSVNVPETIKQAYRKTVDRFNVLNDVDRYLQKRTGKKLNDKDRLYLMGTNTTSSGGMAQQILEKHMLDSQGNVVGESFGDVIAKTADVVGKDNWRAFEDYDKLKHAMSWMRQGRNVYPEESGLSEPVKRIEETLKQIERVNKDNSLTKEQKAHVVEQLEAGIEFVANEIEKGFINPRLSKLEQQFPGIEQAGREYSDWITKFGEEWGVKTGLINPEEWAALRQQYPDYVPLQRVMEGIEEGLMGAKSGFANQKKPIKKGTGSEKDTIESIEVMIERIPQYVKTAKRNEVAQNLYKMMEKYPDEMADAWGRIVKVKPGDPHKPNVITARVNGKEVSMELNNPALLDAMECLSKQGQDVVTELARSATGIMKTLTTGVNPFFAVGRNIFYDTPQAYINSKSLSRVGGVVNNPLQFSVDLMDSLVRLATNDKWHPWSKENYLQMYRDMGGGQFTSASAADRNLIAESKAKIMPGYIDKSKPLTSAGRLTTKGYGGLQRLMSATETLPRLPEFKREVQKGGGTYESKIKGLYEANDITFNFSRSGEVSKFIDAYVPYFNAAVQGIDRVSRAYKDNPVGAVANSIVAVTVPSLLLYAINHDNPAYKMLSETTKSRYYCIPKDDGTFVKIVKPRESGVVFGTALEDIMEYMKENDPDVFDSLILGLKTNFLPPTRTLVAPIASDLRANKDWADRPIVPGYMEDLSPELQYDINTSEPAKWLGEKTGTSPKKIDYLGRSYLGVLGQVGQPLTSEGVGIGETIKRQYTVDPVYSNDVFNKFYEEVDELSTTYSDAKALGEKEPNRKKRLAYNRVVKELSDMRKDVRKLEKDKTIDVDVKRDKLRKLQEEMLGLVDKVVEKYN